MQKIYTCSSNISTMNIDLKLTSLNDSPSHTNFVKSLFNMQSISVFGKRAKNKPDINIQVYLHIYKNIVFGSIGGKISNAIKGNRQLIL